MTEIRPVTPVTAERNWLRGWRYAIDMSAIESVYAPGFVSLHSDYVYWTEEEALTAGQSRMEYMEAERGESLRESMKLKMTWKIETRLTPGLETWEYEALRAGEHLQGEGFTSRQVALDTAKKVIGNVERALKSHQVETYLFEEDELESNKARDERLAHVMKSKERAIEIRNALSSRVGEGIITNRHSGRDDWHIEMTQDAALKLSDLLEGVVG